MRSSKLKTERAVLKKKLKQKKQMKNKNDSTIKYADDPKNRDLKIVKTCDTCGDEYHPRKNSYQTISRFCSAECARKGRNKSGSYSF
jgi:hypothetical protein